MAQKPHTPYVPASQDLPELTLKALGLGALMAIILGAANAYVGMKAGLTVAAAFPAAVVAMAVLRPLRGTILEENLARTAASVGEALVAGAIFTIPAFVISGAWETLHYWESTAIMMVGGVLGVLFVTLLRRTLVVEADLPFPESVAAAEIVKAGQGGQTGASYVLGAMGLAGLWELFKNSRGIHLIQERTTHLIKFESSTIDILGEKIKYAGTLLLSTPSASPMLMGVGFIVGPGVCAVLFSGAVIGWLVLVPLAVFLNPGLAAGLDPNVLDVLADEVWYKQIRPIAVGGMIVAAFQTLYGLRSQLFSGISRGLRDMRHARQAAAVADRTDTDLDFRKILAAIGLTSVATFFLYYYFAQSLLGALLLTVVLVIIGFLFSAVAGYLVGLIGSSNNPISGLTLSALVIAAGLMVAIGLTDVHGVAAVLGVAGVVCCAAGIAGDMMQDLKIGRILGGTPWRMQAAELVGVVAAALVMSLALRLMDQTYKIGSPELSAPQASLMAMMARGIVGGDMAWPLVITGVFFAIGLILIKAPSPMLIAVGMYLPFESTAAMFVGGIIRYIFSLRLKAKNAGEEANTRAENIGILLSSGFIAGEALMAVAIAIMVMAQGALPFLEEVRKALTFGLQPNFKASLLIYPIILYLLAWLPIRRMNRPDLPATRLE